MFDVIDPRRPQDPPWRIRHAHRSLDPAVARLLQQARLFRWWSYADAALMVGVSERYIRYLEAGQRVPSTVVAERLIDVYGLSGWDAEDVRAVALPDVGRASPYRDGRWHQPSPQRKPAAAPAADARAVAPTSAEYVLPAQYVLRPRGVQPSPYA